MWRSCSVTDQRIICAVAEVNNWWCRCSIYYKNTNLSAAVVTLITPETFLILMSFLVLDESIALMKHSITVTTLLSFLNKRVLLPQVNAYVRNRKDSDSVSCLHKDAIIKTKNCSEIVHFSANKFGRFINLYITKVPYLPQIAASNLPRSLLRAMTVSQCGQWNLATFSVCFCRMCIFMVPLCVKRAWQM